MHSSTSILERIGNNPVVRLDRLASGLPVPVLGKCAFLNPGGSGKDRIALAIVDDAERSNLIAPGVDPRRGNRREYRNRTGTGGRRTGLPAGLRDARKDVRKGYWSVVHRVRQSRRRCEWPHAVATVRWSPCWPTRGIGIYPARGSERGIERRVKSGTTVHGVGSEPRRAAKY
jgi:hypothetical protein